MLKVNLKNLVLSKCKCLSDIVSDVGVVHNNDLQVNVYRFTSNDNQRDNVSYSFD